ncbi:T9SS type A sorting domain-containing protein [Winogradskyella sp. DF17]|uniref:T9SS type A sorting domain-containing protein n=1 Tax=Winogradskyella pelagia TaxID=2819984 RepID=A0ABS3T1L6_9FLAO|nr:T9SS type A sorting domain-containing protein [Winogradskyella sp. DF17]MBO3115766.1 T9SS type A sorting domain-containing protein [Winogradskyella sp. DF17]
MKKFYIAILGLLITSFGFGQVNSGDIALLQMITDGTSTDVKFVTFVDIPNGTEINFTDNGWFSTGSFRTGEGIDTWVSPGVSCGDIITFTESSMALSTSGDQIIAFTGTLGSPTILTALHSDGTTWAATATSTNNSALPNGLTDNVDALAIPEVDNMWYSGITTGTIAEIKMAIFNSANWTTDNSATTGFIGSFSLSDCTGGPATPTISFDSATSTENETNTSFNTSIPVTMTNYDAPVTVSVSVSGGDAEAGDYTLNTTSLTFNADETLNVSLDINDDADFDDETIILDLAVTSGTADLGTSQHTVTIIDDDTPPAPSLIISEVADPGDNANARFVEIYNNGSTDIDFSVTPIYISRFVNEAPTATSANTEQLNSGILAAGNYLVIAASGTNFDLAYGFSPDEINGGFAVNGDDPFGMYQGVFPAGTLFDVYGQIGVDGTGEAWEYGDSRAVRNDIMDSPSTTWQASSWTISAANVADATPGASENEFRFNGAWKPRNPNGNATSADDILVLNGSANITSDLNSNNVTIRSAGSLTVNSGQSLTSAGDLTNSGTFALNSTSQLYASLIVNGTVTGGITYNRYTAQVGPTGTNDLVSSPIDGQPFGAFATANTGSLAESGTLRAFAPFNTTSNAYENYDTTANSGTAIASGAGFRAGTQASGGETLAFSGTPNSGDIPVTLFDATSFWNLIGNPYPSHLDIGDFLTENVANTNIRSAFYGVYGYNANSSGSIWTIWDLNVDQDLLITPGQGFFVAAPAGGGSGIDFTETMQRTGSSDDFILGRNASSNNNFAHAILNLNTASTSFVTNVYFRDINTRGLDPGYDTGAFDQTENGVYSYLVEDNTGVALVNQSLPYNDLTNIVVPLVVNLNPNEQITFSLNGTSTLPDSIDVYLDDTVENTSTRLNTADYTITPNAVLSSSERFFLRFAANALSIPQNELDGLQIFTNAQNSTIVVSGDLNENTSASIFDLQGRLVKQVELDASLRTQSISTSGLTTGVYVVQLSNSSQSKTEKVILK